MITVRRGELLDQFHVAPGKRVSARVYALSRYSSHYNSWADPVGPRPGRSHRCRSACQAYTVWCYEITLDGRIVATDNCTDWQQMLQTARRKAILLRHLMGDVTILRYGTLTVGGDELV